MRTKWFNILAALALLACSTAPLQAWVYSSTVYYDNNQRSSWVAANVSSPTYNALFHGSGAVFVVCYGVGFATDHKFNATRANTSMPARQARIQGLTQNHLASGGQYGTFNSSSVAANLPYSGYLSYTFNMRNPYSGYYRLDAAGSPSPGTRYIASGTTDAQVDYYYISLDITQGNPWTCCGC
jgi:hypothetical protein